LRYILLPCVCGQPGRPVFMTLGGVANRSALLIASALARGVARTLSTRSLAGRSTVAHVVDSGVPRTFWSSGGRGCVSCTIHSGACIRPQELDVWTRRVGARFRKLPGACWRDPATGTVTQPQHINRETAIRRSGTRSCARCC
jgi:hypothetical protein